ncbi:hypothetical protein [Rhodococcus sp. ACT016]|uniref:hypothetical protein n=1 Tax=Rhodococcus sp. ACT016 TaxID=3134808 RepID=UPI003D269178
MNGLFEGQRPVHDLVDNLIETGHHGPLLMLRALIEGSLNQLFRGRPALYQVR